MQDGQQRAGKDYEHPGNFVRRFLDAQKKTARVRRVLNLHWVRPIVAAYGR